MAIAQTRGYVQDVLYSGFAGAKTGYVKPAIMTLQTSQCVPMAAIAESNFLSLKSISP